MMSSDHGQDARATFRPNRCSACKKLRRKRSKRRLNPSSVGFSGPFRRGTKKAPGSPGLFYHLLCAPRQESGLIGLPAPVPER